MKRDVRSLFLHDLYHILICHLVLVAHTLRAVLDTGTPHKGVLELLSQCSVNGVAHMFHSASRAENESILEVRWLYR